jgi:hypothetical protein
MTTSTLTPALLRKVNAYSAVADVRHQAASPSADDGDPHLRSCNAVEGYHIRASDGEIGHVQRFLLDDTTWSIRYLIVNTSNWWVGHKVLISPEWIQQVNWSGSFVDVSVDRQTIKSAPVYDEGESFDRDDEFEVYSHYGRETYWRNNRKPALV